MKIRITKPANWYKDLLNEELEVDVVTRYIGTNYEVKNFKEVHKKLLGKNAPDELIGLAVSIGHAEIVEAEKSEMDMVKDKRIHPMQKFFE